MLTKKIKINDPRLYPDGKGGQIGDRGEVNGIPITFVEESGIIHLEKEIDDTQEITVKIDEGRRREIAENHTGQHILSQAILRVADVKTVSFHMGEEYSTIDLDRNLSNEEITKAEDLANLIISEARTVKKYYVNKKDLPTLGLRKISDVPDDRIRIVEIENFDKGMCAGFHVDKTSEVMIIKILKIERVKGGLYRLYFVCGKRALRDYRKKNDIYNELVSLFSSQDLVETAKQKLNELKTTKKKLNTLTKELLTAKAQQIYDKAENFGNIRVGCYKYDYQQGDLRYLVQNILNLGKALFILFNDDQFVIGSNVVNLKNVKIDAKGGGTDKIFMGKFEGEEIDRWTKETLENLKSYI
jgi:alanyl-tRNA synthetase